MQVLILMDASVVPSRYRNIACARARANDKIEVINQRALSVDRFRNYQSHHTYYSRCCISFLEYLRVSNYRYLVPRFHVVLQVTRAYSYDVCLQHSLLPGCSTCIYRIYNIYSILNGSNFVTPVLTDAYRCLQMLTESYRCLLLCLPPYSPEMMPVSFKG